MDFKYNTTLIIGNGFDVNIGMDTKYNSFFHFLERTNFFNLNHNNPLINYIHKAGAEELWYDFEAIIKKFATESEAAITLKRAHNFLKLLDKFDGCDDVFADDLCKYNDLAHLSIEFPSFINSLKTTNTIDSKIVLSQRERTKRIRADIKYYADNCRKSAMDAISLLSDQLRSFINKAHYKTDYSASFFLMSAVLGVYNNEKNGYIQVAQKILSRYTEPINPIFIPQIKIISFNYTNAIENFSSIVESQSLNALDLDDSELQELLYNIHGTLKSNIVFGIDNADNVPSEFWGLKKKNMTHNAKFNFENILQSTKRIVIFGHSIHGVDFEYYKSFFENENYDREIYILAYCSEALDEIKTGLAEQESSPNVKYVVADPYNQEFRQLCKDINDDENEPYIEYLTSIN